MNQPITFAICGFGNRGRDAYAVYQKTHPDLMKIVAVADPVPQRLAAARQEYGVDPALCFDSAEALLARPRLADVMIMATQDRQHVPEALAALDLGYHLLLEKPISPELSDCMALLDKAHATGRLVMVCHVLRYTAFYSRLKELIDQGVVGVIQTLDAVENVGYYHQAHSFVRGNWRSSKVSPMILQKSCHDIDILLWLAGQRCTQVASFGSLRHFDAAHAPAGAPERCTDGCPHSEACPYYAPKIYLTDNVGWPTDMLTTDLSYEGRLKALREGPYGRCVYRCDNDVVDRQVVILAFDKGAVANFTMTAFTTDMARQLKVCGTKGQITADMNTNTILLHRFGEAKARQIALEAPPQTNNYGHGGGDYFLMQDFVQAVRQAKSDTLSSAQASLQSHLICFAAERSRNEKKIVEL